LPRRNQVASYCRLYLGHECNSEEPRRLKVQERLEPDHFVVEVNVAGFQDPLLTDIHIRVRILGAMICFAGMLLWISVSDPNHCQCANSMHKEDGWGLQACRSAHSLNRIDTNGQSHEREQAVRPDRHCFCTPTV